MSVAGRAVHLTPTEYELLFELSVNAGRVLTFDALLDRVWGLGRSGDRGSVRTYVITAPPQAARGRREPEVHLRRASRRLPDAEGRRRGGRRDSRRRSSRAYERIGGYVDSALQ